MQGSQRKVEQQVTTDDGLNVFAVNVVIHAGKCLSVCLYVCLHSWPTVHVRGGSKLCLHP